jgi:hypothetical protein
VSRCLGCVGFCKFRRFSRWLGVRFLSVRSFFFVSFPNLACNSVGNTIHPPPSRRFQRVREPASQPTSQPTSQRIVLCGTLKSASSWAAFIQSSTRGRKAMKTPSFCLERQPVSLFPILILPFPQLSLSSFVCSCTFPHPTKCPMMWSPPI